MVDALGPRFQGDKGLSVDCPGSTPLIPPPGTPRSQGASGFLVDRDVRWGSVVSPPNVQGDNVDFPSFWWSFPTTPKMSNGSKIIDKGLGSTFELHHRVWQHF